MPITDCRWERCRATPIGDGLVLVGKVQPLARGIVVQLRRQRPRELRERDSPSAARTISSREESHSPHGAIGKQRSLHDEVVRGRSRTGPRSTASCDASTSRSSCFGRSTGRRSRTAISTVDSASAIWSGRGRCRRQCGKSTAPARSAAWTSAATASKSSTRAPANVALQSFSSPYSAARSISSSEEPHFPVGAMSKQRSLHDEVVRRVVGACLCAAATRCRRSSSRPGPARRSKGAAPHLVDAHRSLGVAPGGETCATGSSDGTVRIFSLDTGRELWRFQALWRGPSRARPSRRKLYLGEARAALSEAHGNLAQALRSGPRPARRRPAPRSLEKARAAERDQPRCAGTPRASRRRALTPVSAEIAHSCRERGARYQRRTASSSRRATAA